MVICIQINRKHYSAPRTLILPSNALSDYKYGKNNAFYRLFNPIEFFRICLKPLKPANKFNHKAECIMSIMKDIQRYIIQRDGVIVTFRTILTSRGLFAVIIYRFRAYFLQCCAKYKQIGFLFKALSILFMHISVILAKSEIFPNTDIKPGLFISNKGHVIIGAHRIGSRCVIHENVTIGGNLFTKEKPTIGNNVWIGANSVIIGGITISDGSTIREGTVLTKNIPSNCVVQGNPARVTKKGFDNFQLLSNPYIISEAVFETV